MAKTEGPDLMLRRFKLAALAAGRTAGAFTFVGDSRWRTDRLLILAYHGVSLEDEHEWSPTLYMSGEFFERRLQMLKRGGYTVLPFGEALNLLAANKLPRRSVTLTFDDGMYDFHARVFPLLEAYGYPAMVYLTTYYCEFNRPIFNLICPYLLWKAGPRRFNPSALVGEDVACDLALPEGRRAAWQAVARFAERERLSADDKDVLAGQLAEATGTDYAAVREKRLLHLMNTSEVSDLARRGVGFQLHTHRHRTPADRALFDREIVDNRVRIERLTDSTPRHFCYPSGEYRPNHLEWLAGHAVATATTCDPGLAAPSTPRLLLPRFVDTMVQPPVVFESWLTGVASFLPGRRSYASSAS